MTKHSARPQALLEPQERVEAVISAHGSNRTVLVSGREFEVREQVFDPTIAPSGEIGMCFAALPIVRGKTVADVGAGSGIFSCLFALNGAQKVIASDIAAPAIANVRANVRRCGLERIVEVREGRGLAPYSDEDRVDVIYCDLPFADWRVPQTDLDRAFFDVGLGGISEVLHDFSTKAMFAAADLYLCTSSLSVRWQDHLAFSRNLVKNKVLTIHRDWIELQLWRVSRR